MPKIGVFLAIWAFFKFSIRLSPTPKAAGSNPVGYTILNGGRKSEHHELESFRWSASFNATNAFVKAFVAYMNDFAFSPNSRI